MLPDSLNPTKNHLEKKHLFGFRARSPQQTSVLRIMGSCCHLVDRKGTGSRCLLHNGNRNLFLNSTYD